MEGAEHPHQEIRGSTPIVADHCNYDFNKKKREKRRKTLEKMNQVVGRSRGKRGGGLKESRVLQINFVHTRTEKSTGFSEGGKKGEGEK